MAQVGNKPAAVQAVTEYMMDRFAARAIKDGKVNPGSAGTWIGHYGPVLDAIPGLRARFADAATAQRAYTERVARNQGLLSDFDKSAAGRFLNADPDRALDNLFGRKDAAQEAGRLMQAAADRDAQDGLRRGVVDLMQRKFVKPDDRVDTTGLAKFTRDNGEVLDKFFPGLRDLWNTISEDALKAGPEHAAPRLRMLARWGIGGDSCIICLARISFHMSLCCSG